MGGVVEDVVGGISDLGASIDDEVLNTDLGKAALLAGGAYLAAPYVMGTGAATGTGLTAGSTGLGLTGAGTTAYGGLGAGLGTSLGVGAGEAALGAGLAGSTVGGLGLGAGTSALGGIGAGLGTSAAAGGLGATAGSGLLSGVGSALGNLSTAQQIGLGAAALGATGALGGNQPTSSTTTSSIDPDIKAAYLQNLADARATAAGLGQRQFAPMSEYNLGMVQRYMNPYEQEVIQGSLGDIERARQMQRAQENAQATAARAFGGSRQGVTRSLVDEAALRDVANLTSRLRSQGFTQAQNLGLAQEDLRRQLEQQRLDAARGLGVERLGVSQAALSLQPARIGESTTSPIFRNPAASGLGGALAGGQLGSLIGGKQFGTEYAGYGAGIGGLLGLLG